MTDRMPSASDPTTGSAPPPTRWQRIGRWATIACGIIIALGGLAKLLGTFTLPSCDSSRTSDTLRSIFKSRNVEINQIADLKTVTSSFSENTCTALIDAPGEQATIDYRVFWEGWSARVMISEVHSKPVGGGGAGATPR